MLLNPNPSLAAQRKVMSKRKRRFADARLSILLRLGTHGKVMLTRANMASKAFKRLEKEGRIKRVRRSIGSFFGPHIKRTYFTLTP